MNINFYFLRYAKLINSVFAWAGHHGSAATENPTSFSSSQPLGLQGSPAPRVLVDTPVGIRCPVHVWL